ncbi:hypothetical protein Tco_0026392 [Tanacetum coccineum]
MPNPEDISDLTTAIDMALVLMEKAFKLNDTTPTINNQRSSSNPGNRQIAQLGMNIGQDWQMQMVEGSWEPNGLIVVLGIANQNANENGNGNVVATRNEDPVADCSKEEEVGIQLQAEEFDLMAVVCDLEEIKEVNTNCILMANLQQASTSGTQTNNAPVYDSDGSAKVHQYESCYNNEIFNMLTQEQQYTELLEPITEPHPVQQNDNNVISRDPNVEHSGRTVDKKHDTIEATRAYFESLYSNLVIKVEKVNTVNRKMHETNAELTTELARYKGQEKCLEIYQEKYDKLESINTSKKNQSANVLESANQKKHKPNVKKSKKLGSKERLASPRPCKPRTCLRWLTIGRIFDLCGKLNASSNIESASDTFVCDNASASNPQEPISKGFPNSTSFLDRFTRLLRQNTCLYLLAVL